MVTGGASGLGLAVTERLVELGGRVVVLDLHPPVALPPGAAYVEADVGSEAAVDRAMGRGGRRALGLTLAVCCAGISHRGRVVGREGPMAHMDFARVVTVNLIGTFLVCRAAATVMQHNDPEADGERGVIVNTASIAAFDGQIGQAAYAASKGGVVNLTLPLAREFASFGVRVVCIAPGVFETPMVASTTGSVRAGLQNQQPFPQTLRDPRGVRSTGLSHLRKPHAERRGDPARWGLEDECEIALSKSVNKSYMTQPVWSPSAARVAAVRLTRFIAGLDEPGVSDYPSLYAWSLQDPESFWAAVWRICGVVSGQRWDRVLEGGDRMPGARWFPGATLNFAENLMGAADLRPALVFRAESGERRELSRADLHREVARLAAGLRAACVGVGDRVAGYLPNVPETATPSTRPSSDQEGRVAFCYAGCAACFSAYSNRFRSTGTRLSRIDP